MTSSVRRSHICCARSRRSFQRRDRSAALCSTVIVIFRVGSCFVVVLWRPAAGWDFCPKVLRFACLRPESCRPACPLSAQVNKLISGRYSSRTLFPASPPDKKMVQRTHVRYVADLAPPNWSPSLGVVAGVVRASSDSLLLLHLLGCPGVVSGVF